MSVSVVIPTYQAGKYLTDCFAALEAQTFDGPVEILVIDGGSNDDTRAIVRRAVERGLPVRLISNPQRRQAVGLNRGIRAARHDIIVRCDAQSRFPPDTIERLVAEHAREPHLNVGGRQVAIRSESSFGDAVAAVYNTAVGSGGAQYRVGERGGDVDTVYLGSWRRVELLAIGGFDPWFHPNEDAELNLRWRREGHTVRLLPDLAIGYVSRDAFGALARQYNRYGRARARTVVRHRAMQPRQVAALGPTVALLLLALSGWAWLVALPAVGYGLILGWTAVRSHVRPAARALIPLALATMHLAWGTGFFAGFLHTVLIHDALVPQEALDRSDARATRTT